MYPRIFLALFLLAPLSASAVNLVPVALRMPFAEAEALDNSSPIFGCSPPVGGGCTSLAGPVAGPDSITLDWSLPAGGGAGTFVAGIDTDSFVMSQSGALFATGADYGVAAQVQIEFDVPDLGLPTTAIVLLATVETNSVIAGQPGWSADMNLLCSIGYVTPRGAGCATGYHSTILGTDVGLDPGGTSLRFFRFSEQDGSSADIINSLIVDFIAGDTVRFVLHAESGASAQGGLSFDQEIRLSAFAISNYVPEPATGLLLVAGMLGLVRWRGRLH